MVQIFNSVSRHFMKNANFVPFAFYELNRLLSLILLMKVIERWK